MMGLKRGGSGNLRVSRILEEKPGPTYPPLVPLPATVRDRMGMGVVLRAAGGKRNTLQASLGSSCSPRKFHVGPILDTDLEGKKEEFFTRNQLGAL